GSTASMPAAPVPRAARASALRSSHTCCNATVPSSKSREYWAAAARLPVISPSSACNNNTIARLRQRLDEGLTHGWPSAAAAPLIRKKHLAALSWKRHAVARIYRPEGHPASSHRSDRNMTNGNSQRSRRTKVRTLFLSDIHLGYKRARARELNEFLHGIEAQNIVLVGDIVDALSMARRFFWSPEHTQIVRTLLARQRAGSRLIYIPGNHDASLGVMAEMLQGQLEVHREWVHQTSRGERLLVLHG